MSNKEIDKRINDLVREKQLLQKSLKRTSDEKEIKGIKLRLIEVTALINIEKSKYKEEGEKVYE